MERLQRYQYLFRCAGQDPVIVRHDTRPGDAEACARKMAKLVAKKMGTDEVRCLWKGPETAEIPEEIRAEIRKETQA